MNIKIKSIILVLVVFQSCTSKYEKEKIVNNQIVHTVSRTNNYEIHGDLNLRELREEFGSERAGQVKREQFTSLDLFDEKSGNAVFLEKSFAEKQFYTLMKSKDYIIEYKFYDHITDNWLEQSRNVNNWVILDGFKNVRNDGFIDFCFRVKPHPDLVGIDVLKTFPNKPKSQLPTNEIFIWFAGDSPSLERLGGKKIAMMDEYGKFYNSIIDVQDKKFQRLYNDVTVRKIPFKTEEDMAYFRDNMGLIDQYIDNKIESQRHIFRTILGIENKI